MKPEVWEFKHDLWNLLSKSETGSVGFLPVNHYRQEGKSVKLSNYQGKNTLK